MSDSPYDPSPETLDRIRDRAAAEAAAQRVAGDADLKAAVDKLKQVERDLEQAAKNAPPPPSSGVTYLPEVRPQPVKGHLTVPRIEVRAPPPPRQRTTVRALSLQPLVKLGFANVVNDGEGDVKAAFRWGRVVLFTAPFIALAALGFWRIVRADAGTATGETTGAQTIPAPKDPTAVAPLGTESPAATPPSAEPPSADPPSAELPPLPQPSHAATAAAPLATEEPSNPPSAAPPTKTSAPKSTGEKPKNPPPKPSASPWKPEF